MTCDISLNDPPVTDYVPRNAIDHMSPYFFRNHHHAHSHHRRHHVKHTPLQTDSSSSTDASHDSLSSSEPCSPSSSIPPPADLQTPTPRHISAAQLLRHPNNTLLSSSSYTTPPATPPLTLLTATPSQAKANGTSKSAARSTCIATAAAAATDRDHLSLAWCTARARIPTPDGSEYFLHIYENTKDKKEHLAFVFGDAIRSKSLDQIQPGETEMDRIRRGAYEGRLQPIETATATTTTTVTLDQDVSMDQSCVTVTTTTATTIAAATKASVDQDVVMEATERKEATMIAPPLVRIHSECFTGEIGHSARCDCGEQLDEAIRLMKEAGSGVVVYLRQEGRGIGLGEKLKAYNLQDLGYDTVMANLLLNHGEDERTYEIAQAIIEDLGLSQIRLLTNNPDKMEQIVKDSTIKVVERVPMVPKSWEAIQQGTEDQFVVREGSVENKIVKGKELDKYLKVKVERMRHLISIPPTL